MKPKYTIGDVADVFFIDKVTGKTVLEINAVNMSLESVYDEDKNLTEVNLVLDLDVDVENLEK